MLSSLNRLVGHAAPAAALAFATTLTTTACDNETVSSAAAAAAAAAAASPPLDVGYLPKTAVELAIVRKRPALPPRESEPLFTTEEVARHDDADAPQGLWVTYKDGVYDLTVFTNLHPGGRAS